MTTKSKQINIVLVETSHPGNIGSAARAMKTMGLSELSLVNPKDFPSGDANALSGNARDILDKAKIFKNLKDALIDSHHIFATSSRKRTITWPTYTPKEAALEIDTKLKESQKISIVFGREDRGLTNEELELTNSLIEIPANPEYPVLNLAMSVQVIAYEIFQLLDFNEEIEWRDSPLATSDEVQHLITHFIDTAESIDVIDKSNPGKIIKRMQRMFTRLQPDKMETNFLRGFLAAVNKQKK